MDDDRTFDPPLHVLDKQANISDWTDVELDEKLIFCMLDAAVPYRHVCEAYEALHRERLTDRIRLNRQLRRITLGTRQTRLETWITDILYQTGYRWAGQTAHRIVEFASNDIDLRICTREELVESVCGIGMKLASMFLRDTRKAEYAVLDVHVKRWMRQTGYEGSSKYEEMEKWFLDFCDKFDIDPYQLDMQIWEKHRA